MNKYKEKINLVLQNFFDAKIIQTAKISKFNCDIVKILKEYTLRGGKRLRSLLMIYAYQALGGNKQSEIIKASAAMELVQTSLLIHDDIMDQDNLRRGGESVHYKYSKYFDEVNEHFGVSIAIIAGNIAASYVFDVIGNTTFSDSKKIKAMQIIIDYLAQVNFGQAEDILLSKKENFTEAGIEKVHYFKSMTYTAMMPILSGASLADYDKEKINALKIYAQNVGLAFQIHDDIIGIFGDTKKTGKPNGSDLSQNKKTFLILKTLEYASKTEQEFIKKLLGQKSITVYELEKARKIIIKTKSLEYSRKKAQKLIGKAINAIQKSTINQKSQIDLIKIANFIIDREK